ncbi:hypothetical protein SAMN04489729_7266 [Amycolatopsis lurida]|nr:hypothetical protein SAMN04489729_7266 [Amycolatopsis lurida]
MARDEGRTAGHGARTPFLPALGRVFTEGREAAFPATGGSLGSRDPWLLVSVNALPRRVRPLGATPHPHFVLCMRWFVGPTALRYRTLHPTLRKPLSQR